MAREPGGFFRVRPRLAGWRRTAYSSDWGSARPGMVMRKRVPFPSCGLDFDIPAVIFDRGLHYSKTQAGSIGPGRKERIENLLDHFLVHAFSVIFHFDANG